MAGLMVVLMLSAPLSGCFGEDSPGVSSTELKVNPEALIAGEFQPVSLRADSRMSVYIPYLIKDPGTGFVQNSTVVDIAKGEEVTLEVLVPPRTDGAFILVGEYGRIHWPIREQSESWDTWLSRGAPAAWTVKERSGRLPTTPPSTAWRFTPPSWQAQSR